MAQDQTSKAQVEMSKCIRSDWVLPPCQFHTDANRYPKHPKTITEVQAEMFSDNLDPTLNLNHWRSDPMILTYQDLLGTKMLVEC